jgi:hypothetical protein
MTDQMPGELMGRPARLQARAENILLIGLLACGWLEMAVAVLLAVTCLPAWLPLLGEQQMPADLAASAGWW